MAAESLKFYSPGVVIRSGEWERARFMERVGEEAWAEIGGKGCGGGGCGGGCEGEAVDVVTELVTEKLASERFSFGGSFMEEGFVRINESEMCLKNSRAEAREPGQFSKLTVLDGCMHYRHLVKITDEAEYCSKQTFIKLLKSILNDDSQRISLGNGFFVLTQFDRAFKMNFSLIRKVSCENCSGKDKASIKYENCLGISVKLNKVDEGDFYLLDIQKAHGDSALFKEVSENVFKRLDSFMI